MQMHSKQGSSFPLTSSDSADTAKSATYTPDTVQRAVSMFVGASKDCVPMREDRISFTAYRAADVWRMDEAVGREEAEVRTTERGGREEK